MLWQDSLAERKLAICKNDEISLCPAQEVNLSFVQSVRGVFTTHLVLRGPLSCQLQHCSVSVQASLILLNNDPNVQE